MFRIMQQLVVSLIYSSLLVPVLSPSECYVKQNAAVQENQFTLRSSGTLGTLISSFVRLSCMKLALKTF